MPNRCKGMNLPPLSLPLAFLVMTALDETVVLVDMAIKKPWYTESSTLAPTLIKNRTMPYMKNGIKMKLMTCTTRWRRHRRIVCSITRTSKPNPESKKITMTAPHFTVYCASMMPLALPTCGNAHARPITRPRPNKNQYCLNRRIEMDKILFHSGGLAGSCCCCFCSNSCCCCDEVAIESFCAVVDNDVWDRLLSSICTTVVVVAVMKKRERGRFQSSGGTLSHIYYLQTQHLVAPINRDNVILPFLYNK